MEFTGAFELPGVPPAVAVQVLTDPRAIEQAVPGCEYIVPEEGHDFDAYEHDSTAETLPEADPDAVGTRSFQAGESYVALTRIGVKNINPTFESHVTVEERDGHSMLASGHGSTAESEYTMETTVSIEDTSEGSVVEWAIEVTLSGKIGQFNDIVLRSIGSRVIEDFAENLAAQMQAAAER